MTDHRQQRIKELFQAAVQREPAERPAFLDQQCGDDAELRTAVESLLEAGEGAGDFLQNAPLLSAGGLDPVTLASPGSEPARWIDRYHLHEKIGEGGMGEVWLAEQQEPVRRRVALKVIKAGMDTAQVIARFEAERQALAMMDHPAIARVFDAGATPAGRPYFVMEHVMGLPITQHCDEQRLRIRERLELFVQVCEGVQHAHQKAVLHRDLKPSNVLVAIQDGRAAPKIIDFGVAKAMTAPLTERTLYTGLGTILGTPGYMSPEQADLTGRDVDTRTDVYSLGVVLYELQVGVLPFDPQRLRNAGWEGLGRLLRDEEPATPSRRLATLSPEVSAESSVRRRLDVPALRRRLSGDLDRITMRAIEPDRERRYATPLELAEDIRRHLRDEPVLAGSQGTIYRVRKFVRRHRLGVAAASLVTAVAAAALVGVTVGLVRATRAEAEATRQAVASERVSGFLSNLLASVDAERMGRTLVADLRTRVEKAERTRGRSDTQVAAALTSFDRALQGVNRVDAARQLVDREILSRAGETIDKEMKDDPLLAARLQATLGKSYHELSMFVTAGTFYEKALETRRRLLGPEHPDTLRLMTELGRDYYSSERVFDAEKVLQQAVDAQTQVLGPEHPDTLHSMSHLAFAKTFAGKPHEAEPLYRHTLQIRRRVLGEEHPDTLHTMRLLADDLIHLGRPAEAETLYRHAMDVQRRVLGPEDTETLRTRGNMARAYIGVGRFEDAERLSLDVIDVRRRVSGEDNLLTILSLCYLGMGYVAQNRHAEAERVLSDALERSRRGESILITNLAANALAGSYRSQGRLADAERLYRTTLQGLGSNRGATYDWNLVKRAELVALQGRRAEAEQLYHEALALRRRTLGEDHSSTIATLRALMRLLESDTDTYRARERIEPLLADLRRHAEKPGASADLKNVCAWELLTCKPAALHDPQRALELALSAAAATGRQDPDVLNTLALAYHEVGRSDEAVRTAREARALLPAGPSFLRSAIEANLAEYEKASAGSIRGQRDE